MRIVLFFLAVSITQALALDSYGQSKRLNLNFNNETIVKILNNIEDQSEFYFMYDATVIDVNQRKSIDCENSTITKILDELFQNTGITYKIDDRQIALKRANEISGSVISQGNQQQKSVSGKVTDSSRSPLPGVTVVIKGTTNGTVTNTDGEYSLSNVSEDAILQFSFVGMKTQEIPVSGKTNINVTMVEEAIGIEEVVAIGYGTMKRTELTSAVSSVKADDFVKGSATDAAQLLKGKVAGLSIIQPDADPTSTSQIYLRGVTTLESGTEPLVIIDGIPSSLSLVAPEDIESIDILKDGSAAAIYGTRGTNGVILITTKKIKKDMPSTIEVESYTTIQTINKRLDFMNATEFREKAIGGGYLVESQDYGYDTDWLEEILRVSVSQSHNVNLKGGNSKTNYIVNLNYKDTEGIVQRTNNNEFKTRIEANHTMFNNKLKINANILSRQQKLFSGWDDEIYKMALIYNPTERPKDDDGNWNEHTEILNYSNPLAMLYEVEGDATRTTLRTAGSLTYLPINNLSLDLTASKNTSNYFNGYYETQNHISTIRNSKNGYASRSTNKTVDDLLQITLKYSLLAEKHNMTFMGGYSWEEYRYESFYAENWDFPSDQYSYNSLDAGEALTRGEALMGSYQVKSNLISFFSRINYSYDNKYMLMASLRHEGSSKFGENNKWGNFPAVSVGWNIKNESFMSDVAWLNSLKLRAGWGITGTTPSDSYVSISRLSTTSNFLLNGEWTSVLKPSSNSNPDLRWEKKKETNIGLDFGLFKDRLSLSIDAYLRKTIDLLWDYNVSKPPYLYDSVVANAGSIENKGIELNINANIIKSMNCRWDSRINFSTNKNKVLSLNNELYQLSTGYIDTGDTGEPIQETTHRLEEGGKVGNFYGYKTIDIDDDGKWIIEAEDGSAIAIADQSAEDKKIIGNGIPKYFLSWDNTFRYKKFDLSVIMNGAFGFDILNITRLMYNNPIWLSRGNVLNSAFDEKIYGKRILSADQELQYVSYYIEKGNYWKIGNVAIGYNLGEIGSVIKDMRIYASGSNLITFTSYKGNDPEVSILGLSPGIDGRDRYPSARSFTLGLSLTF